MVTVGSKINPWMLKPFSCKVNNLWKLWINVKVAQSCLPLWDPVECTVHGILCTRILEWVAIPFSRGSSQRRDWTWVSCAAGKFFIIWALRETVNFYMARSGKQRPYAVLSMSGSGRRNRNHALTEKYNLCFISIYRCAGFCLYFWEWST